MLDPVDIQKHPVAGILVLMLCVWGSLGFIVRIWFAHREAGVSRKLVWSIIVLIPIFGWLAYGAFFRSSSAIDPSAPRELSTDMITVANCYDLKDALRLQMRVGCGGIDSVIPDENTAALATYYLIGSSAGVRLQVANKDARKARKILEKHPDKNEGTGS
ncbi:MAG: hypothetical protein ACR2II_08185 [Chthoniobacterales bacterium]